MLRAEFEKVLDQTVEILTENVRSSTLYHGPDNFEHGVLDMLRVAARDSGLTVSPTYHKHAFPDIRVNGFGVEVKYTKHDTWLAVGNSIFEGMRDPNVSSVYVILGKIGGTPEVRWRRYEESITHVRMSNSPRCVIELSGSRPALFSQLNVTYEEFARLDAESKMNHVREYYRQRSGEGERLWWLGTNHTLPVAVRIYRKLTDLEKRRLRAEAVLLCPEIVQPGTKRGKYDRAGLYLMTQHGVFAPQLRDLFSAGSVGARTGRRGHKYIADALKDIETEMRNAAFDLDDQLFCEHWGFECPPEDRIRQWLKLADRYASDWRPSKVLFRG